MRNKIIYLISSFLLTCILIACSTSSSVTQYDYSYLYDENQAVINPAYKVFHHSSDSSTLFYEINSGDILYERLNGDSSLVAKLKLKYTIYQDKALTIILDSAQKQVFNFGSNAKETVLQNHFKFKAQKGNAYWLVIRFRDDNKDLNVVNLLKVDKRDNLNSQYFNYKTDQKVLIHSISNATNVEITKSPLIESNLFVMEQSDKNFPMTPPPFIKVKTNQLNVDFDDSYSFNFQGNKYQATNLKAFNRFQVEQDTSQKSNFVFYFSKAYPKISKIGQLLEPTRYISTSKEYKVIKTAVNPKKALDEFWLRLGKNEERAKAMLQEYYSRVELSNRYFSCYKEGWKSDRGIIYIIYGNPTTIRKDAESEIWTYGEADNILSVQFKFYKKTNNFSNNDYELIRNVEYKNNWYRAVDQWRQGKIY
ncbi:MAG: GWxTD domain-containing protein [Flavobacteriales bacterium]|nr:GWxTD domain-containing protein [Flavobacteriales bacterium]